MDIRFNCSKCGQKIAVEPSMAGSVVSCPACHVDLHVPGGPSSTPAPTRSKAHGQQAIWIALLVLAVLMMAGVALWLFKRGDSARDMARTEERVAVRNEVSTQTGETDARALVAVAATALGKRSYSWTAVPSLRSSEAKTNRPMMTINGQTDGRMSYLKTITAEDSGYVAFEGARIAYDSGRGWTRLDTSENAARQRAGRILLKNQPPAVEALALIEKARTWEQSGNIIRAQLNETFAEKQLGSGESTRDPSVKVRNASGTATFHIAEGLLSKLEVVLTGLVSRPGEQETEITYGTVWEVTGLAPPDIPAEVRKILQSN